MAYCPNCFCVVDHAPMCPVGLAEQADEVDRKLREEVSLLRKEIRALRKRVKTLEIENARLGEEIHKIVVVGGGVS